MFRCVSVLRPVEDGIPILHKRRRLLLAATLGLSTGPLVAQAPAKLSHIDLVSDEWHDLTRKDGTGLYFDLIRMVYRRVGIESRIRIFPYARTVQIVRDKKADAWVASFMKEKDFPLYPKWHFDQNTQVVVFRKDLAGGFQGLASLRNKRVAWLRDFGLDRYIPEPMKITEVDAIAQALQMLNAGRLDYFVGARSDLEDVVRKEKPDMSKLDTRFAMNLGLFLAFADTPRGALLRDLWDKEMDTLHKAPEFKAIYRKYGYDYPFAS